MIFNVHIYSTRIFLVVIWDHGTLCNVSVLKTHGFPLFPRLNKIYCGVVSCILQFITEILP